MKLIYEKKMIEVMPCIHMFVLKSLLCPYVCFSDIQLKRDFMKKYELWRRKYFLHVVLFIDVLKFMQEKVAS